MHEQDLQMWQQQIKLKPKQSATSGNHDLDGVSHSGGNDTKFRKSNWTNLVTQFDFEADEEHKENFSTYSPICIYESRKQTTS